MDTIAKIKIKEYLKKCNKPQSIYMIAKNTGVAWATADRHVNKMLLNRKMTQVGTQQHGTITVDLYELV